MNTKVLEPMKEEIRKLIWEGKTYREICPLYNVRKETVARLVRQYKFPRIHFQYFDNIDTEVKAYILGFIFADGSIYRSKSKDGYCLEIGLNIRDAEFVELVRDEICPSRKIYYRKRKVVLNISSKYLCETLMNKFNLTLNKSHNIYLDFNINEIPLTLQRHFIRGFFDGDGHVGFRNRYKRTKAGERIALTKTTLNRFGFTSSHIKFLEYLSETFDKLGFKHRLYNRDKYTNNLHFTLNKVNSKIVYDFFYKDSNYFLSRKKKSFEAGLNNTEVSS